MRERSGRQDVPQRSGRNGLARRASATNATDESGGEAEIAGGVGCGEGPRREVYGALVGRLTAECRGSEDLCACCRCFPPCTRGVDPKGYSVTLDGDAAGAGDAGAVVPLTAAGNTAMAACVLAAAGDVVEVGAFEAMRSDGCEVFTLESRRKRTPRDRPPRRRRS